MLSGIYGSQNDKSAWFRFYAEAKGVEFTEPESAVGLKVEEKGNIFGLVSRDF